MDCIFVISKFEFQSCNCVHFRTNTLEESNETPYPPNYGLNSTATVQEEWLWH